MVSCGGKHALYNLFQVIFDQGDEVVVPAPFWVSYPPMLMLAEATPVIIPTREENGFKLTAAELKASLTPRTKALVLNSPSNPTGGVYTAAELSALGEVALAAGLYVISDDIYDKIMFDGAKFVNMAMLSPELKARTFVFNGVSKAYAMTGWRLGYAAGPQDIISAMIRIQEHMNTNTSSITQYAAVEALNGQQESVASMAQEFKKRRDYMYDRLTAMPGVKIRKPPGAFYMFPDVSALFGKTIRGKKIETDMDLVESILTEGHVAVVPGSGFGSPNNIRISYATSMERITTGMDRMEALLKEAK
jgi:aspartate aminotransferase